MNTPKTPTGKALLSRGSNNWMGDSWIEAFAANIAKAESEAAELSLAGTCPYRGCKGEFGHGSPHLFEQPQIDALIAKAKSEAFALAIKMIEETPREDTTSLEGGTFFWGTRAGYNSGLEHAVRMIKALQSEHNPT